MPRIQDLSDQLGQHLVARQLIVTTAESCTGGGVAQAITAIAGSSQWFSHGFITYSNQAKQQLLNVDSDLINTYGAVSQDVVESMACGALLASGADVAVAVSGIAGPDGGSSEKPVGTVWIGWASQENLVSSQKFLFLGNRNSVRNQSVEKSLEGLIEIIIKNTV